MCARRIVSLKPHSALHKGHHFVVASGPEYQLRQHVSQPKMLLHHLARISGGLMGITRQIAHLKHLRQG